MTELKTLKELKLGCGDMYAPVRFKAIEELKAEAIKWVNHWLKTLGNPKFLIDEKHCVGFKKKEMERFNMTQCEACASIGAFVNFFNITDEDLK